MIAKPDRLYPTGLQLPTLPHHPARELDGAFSCPSGGQSKIPSQPPQSLPQMRTHRLIIAEAHRPFKGSLRVADSAGSGHQVPPRRPIRLVIAQSFLRQGLQQRQTPLGPKSMRARDRMANARPHLSSGN